MKKFVSLITAISILFTLGFSALAQETADKAKQLEGLITKVKSVIDIPEAYEKFASDQRTDADGTIHWNFNWSTPTSSEYYRDVSGISVAINENGFIESYSKYGGPYKYSEYVKIPALSGPEADEKVKAFISKITPEIGSQLEWKEPTVGDGNYFYNFSRIVNGISFPSNMASYTVNGQNGEVTSYYSNWNTKAEFPDPAKAISAEKAKEIFKDKIPFELEYKSTYKGKVYLQYTTPMQNTGKYINAVSGEIESPSNNYGIYDGARGYAMAKESMNSSLTPAEQKEVDSVANAITAADAEKKLRSITELNFDKTYKLSSSSLYQVKSVFDNSSTYYLNLYFTKLDNTEGLSEEDIKQKIVIGEGNGYAHVSFNAITGELLTFSSSNWVVYKTSDKKAANRADNKKIADNFIAKQQPEKTKAVKFLDNDNENLIYQYYRTENGIFLYDNFISVGVDKENGKINEYMVNWENGIKFPSAQGVISKEKAHEILFDKSGLKLEYVLSNDKPVLAFKLNDQRPNFIDAMSGEFLDYSGNPYVETAAPKYSDIDGHFAETAIKTLSGVGVFLEGASFNPDNGITQVDYFRLLSKLGRYYGDKNDIEGLYSFLIQNGVMDEAEKNPESTVTREDAVKYLLRYLGYKKFAEIKGIFKTEFNDVSDINENLIGYAAIAQGIGIVKGSDGNFLPKKTLTRGEAAVVIYNCLSAGLN